MAIHSVGQMASTLKNYNVDNWSKSVELGSKVDFRGDFPPMEEASESNQSFGDFLANLIIITRFHILLRNSDFYNPTNDYIAILNFYTEYFFKFILLDE